MERLLIHLISASASGGFMAGYQSKGEPQADLNEWWNRYKAVHHAIVQAINDGPANGWPDVTPAVAAQGPFGALLAALQGLLGKLAPPATGGGTATPLLPPGGPAAVPPASPPAAPAAQAVRK